MYVLRASASVLARDTSCAQRALAVATMVTGFALTRVRRCSVDATSVSGAVLVEAVVH